VVDDILPVLWKKLLVNAGINAVTALTGVRNGEMVKLKPAGLLMQDIIAEAGAVARAHSIDVSDDILEYVKQVAGATASNRSSMGQDVDDRRPTEIKAINGYLVQKAGEKNIAVPVNQTLVWLVQALEQGYTSFSHHELNSFQHGLGESS